MRLFFAVLGAVKFRHVVLPIVCGATVLVHSLLRESVAGLEQEEAPVALYKFECIRVVGTTHEGSVIVDLEGIDTFWLHPHRALSDQGVESVIVADGFPIRSLLLQAAEKLVHIVSIEVFQHMV
jgi:hypothetical protein